MGKKLTDNRDRKGDKGAESRSKADLLSELALNKDDADKRVAHLMSELQARQAELEMQNRELREAQQRLEETRDRYAALYDFSPVGYLTLDISGLIVEINLTGAAMLGLERANIVGKPFASHLANGDTYAFSHHLRQTFQSPGNSIVELRIINHDGGVNHVRLESAVVLNEKRVCQTVMTNITEQQRTVMELQQMRTEQEALLSAIPAFVFYKDMNLRYVAVSKVFADFLGRSTADVLGKTDFELFPRALAEDLQRISHEVLESGKLKSDIEDRLTDLNGNRIFLSTVLAAFYNHAGKVAGLLGVGIDISPLQKAANINKDLVRQNRTLTQNLFSIQESQRRHLARELHDELGQWLTAIQAEAQAIDSLIAREDRIAASVQAIMESARIMHKVIRNMLRQLRPTLLDELGLADSVRELVNKWKAHHPDIGCELVLEGDLGGCEETTNITTYRIIQEALSNISRHAQADRVLVRLRREHCDESEPDFLLLSVEDNGKGFDQDRTPGFGLLGMRERAIVANGRFSLRNNPGQGVRIDALLPLNCHAERRKP